MKTLSNGVDMVEINRFRPYKSLLDIFFTKIFTKKEVKYCSQKKDPYPYLAARFAAKEAVCKAFGNLNISIPLHEIEIIKNCNQSLSVKINNNCHYIKDYKITLSVSHTELMAIAFCTIWRNK